MKLKVAELEKSRQDDLRSYQKIVRRFLKAFKFETRRILLTLKSDLDFFELERVMPSDLEKVVTEDKAAKKSSSKLRKGQKVKKKVISEKPSSECLMDTSILPDGVSIKADPSV